MRKPRIINNNGSCYIRFTHMGVNYRLAPGGRFEDKLARSAAEQIALKIYNDLVTGNFDTTLDKYQKYKKPDPPKESHIDLLKKRLSKLYSSIDESLIRILTTYNRKILDKADAERFLKYLKEKRCCSNITVSRYLTVLKNIDPEVFGEIKLKTEKRKRRKPFSKDEVCKILEGFKELKPHYYNYVYYLFNSGCRTSEAIGVRWKDINFEKNEIYVGGSLGRDRGYPSRRVRRTTKTGESRIVIISNQLKNFLLSIQPEDFNQNDLLFKSTKNKPINDHTFAQKHWRDVLKLKEVEYRPPYTTRHTFISHCLESGINPVKLSEITGHNVDTLYKHYAGVIDKIEIPDLF